MGRRFKLRSVDGSDITPQEWLRLWSDRYPTNNYAGYSELIAKYEPFSAEDFVRIGKWKDAVQTPAKWKPNVASVAYPIWMQAASELPKCPEGRTTGLPESTTMYVRRDQSKKHLGFPAQWRYYISLA